MAGGIGRLLGLIRDHRGAVEYDFRRLGIALTDVGDGVSILEAARIATILERDQSSWTFAAVEGWEHPWSREAEVMATLVDMWASGETQYPRPWSARDERPKGDLGGRTHEEAQAILRRNARG